jgi:hypothetical protein
MPARAATPACSTNRVCLPRSPGRPAPEESRRHRIFAERQANQICRISGPKLPHHPGTMTFERPWADLHPHGALLVGTSLADMTQNLPLPRGQKRLDGLRTSGLPGPFASRLPSVLPLRDHQLITSRPSAAAVSGYNGPSKLSAISLIMAQMRSVS